MSVLMTMRANGDGTKLEELDHDTLRAVADRGKEYGVIRHRIWGSDSEIMVVDEWPDEDSFRRFFEASPEIPELVQRAGVTSEPEITFWRLLDTGDEVG